MREDLERILMMFQFEFNDERTRREIKYRLESYLSLKVDEGSIINFKVEDRTNITVFQNQDFQGFNFQIIYQPTRVVDFHIIDITLMGNSVVISDFENNVIGKRSIPKFNL